MIKFFETLPQNIQEEFFGEKETLANHWGESLTPKLFYLAEGVVSHYNSDLGHDCAMLALSKPGDIFLWSPRESGTHMVRTSQGAVIVNDYLRASGAASIHYGATWYAIVVTQAGVGASGRIARLGTTDDARLFCLRIGVE